MKMQIYRAIHRHSYKSDWLNAYQTFPPGEPSFFSIQEISENYLKPALGFPVSTFSDTEIITLILQGSLSHQDDAGNVFILRPGDVQLVSAGHGITQSELNASDKEEVHFLQMRIKPKQLNEEPHYQKKQVKAPLAPNSWQLIISPGGKEDTLQIQQTINIYLATLDKETELTYSFSTKQAGWLQVIEGMLTLAEHEIEAGDAISMTGDQKISIKAQSFSQVLLFVIDSI